MTYNISRIRKRIDNEHTESAKRTIKYEMFKGNKHYTVEKLNEAKQTINVYIHFYKGNYVEITDFA